MILKNVNGITETMILPGSIIFRISTPKFLLHEKGDDVFMVRDPDGRFGEAKIF